MDQKLAMLELRLKSKTNAKINKLYSYLVPRKILYMKYNSRIQNYFIWKEKDLS